MTYQPSSSKRVPRPSSRLDHPAVNQANKEGPLSYMPRYFQAAWLRCHVGRGMYYGLRADRLSRLAGSLRGTTVASAPCPSLYRGALAPALSTIIHWRRLRLDVNHASVFYVVTNVISSLGKVLQGWCLPVCHQADTLEGPPNWTSEAFCLFPAR